MGIKDIIEGKKEWREHKARVKLLPQDYQLVYKEVEKYIFKVGPVDLIGENGVLTGIVALFEQGSTLGKGVLKVTGSDVATFCDELIGDAVTYFDVYEESINEEVRKAIKKTIDKR